MSTIIPGFLYLGSYEDACNLNFLRQHNIGFIVNLAYKPPCAPNEFRYLNINIYDHPHENIIQHADKVINFVDQAVREGKAVLIHCMAGISRSTSMVMVYLMKRYNLNVKQAYEYILRHRPIVLPNVGFSKQLMDYDEQLHPYTALAA